MRCFAPGDRLRFDYINHEGILSKWDVIFRALDFGTNEWYPEPQWFMRCHDLSRDAARSFALNRIAGGAVEVVHLGLSKAEEALPWVIRDIDDYRAYNKGGTVINCYTSEPRRFPTRAAAASYAELSHWRKPEIEELR